MKRIKVTVVFEMTPEPLGAYEAATVEEAAENLRRWYEDGSASLIEDVANADDSSFKIEVVG